MAPFQKHTSETHSRNKDAALTQVNGAATGARVNKTKKQQQVSSNSSKNSSWHKINVEDDFLLGSTEYGFMGLEELKPEAGSIFTEASLLQPKGDARGATPPDLKPEAGPVKKLKRKRHKDAIQPLLHRDSTAAPESSASSKQPVNAVMVAQQPAELVTKKTPKARSPPGAVGASLPRSDHHQPAQPTAEPSAEHQKARRSKRRKAASLNDQIINSDTAPVPCPSEVQAHSKKLPGSERAQPTPAGSSAAANVVTGVSRDQLPPNAWQQFELHPSLEGALLAQGFFNPTPIQDACLMPAVRGRCDVIGAAQTVTSIDPTCATTHLLQSACTAAI